MSDLNVAPARGVDVHASEIQTRRRADVKLPMQYREQGLTALVNRAVGNRHEVEVADAGEVVAGRQGSRDKQIADPIPVPPVAGQIPGLSQAG